MADATTVRNLYTPTVYSVAVHLTNISDGTGESGVKKVDITTLLNIHGVQPNGLRIMRVQWAMQGFTTVQLLWDRTAAAEVAVILDANGYQDYRPDVLYPDVELDGYIPATVMTGYADPSAGNADNKGSILLTTVGASATATYDITLWLRLEQNAS